MAIALLDSQLEGLTGEDTELLTVGECYAELAAIHQRMNQPEEAIALLKKGLSIYKQLPQQMNATAGMASVVYKNLCIFVLVSVLFEFDRLHEYLGSVLTWED